jgi:DNA-binding CsgD family transcriptional regulator
MVMPNLIPEWLKNGDFSALPDPAKPTAAYQRVIYLSQQNNPELMLAVAQASLSLCGTENAISDRDTYLRILCAEACLASGRENDAKNYLRGVMKKTLPHGIISPYAERLAMFGGFCEHMLRYEFPDYYEKIIEHWERATKNWGRFHNRFTRDNIATILPLREYQMARFAAQGYSDKRIAEHFNLAPGTVKNKLDEIYSILCISGSNRKKALAKFIL